MNTKKIQELSTQINLLDTFHKRCLWADAAFSVSEHTLSVETSALIKQEIHEAIDKRIEILEAELRKEASNG